MGSVVKAVTKPFKSVAGKGLPLLGIDNPFDDSTDISTAGIETIGESADELKKKKAATFTSGGILGEELQAGTGTTFGN